MKRAALTNRFSTLASVVVLGLLFLALSYVRIAGDTRSAAFGGSVIEAAVSGSVWGTALGHNLLLFGLVQVFIHVALASICWGLAVLSRTAWPDTPHSERTWLLLWFVLSAFWILIANAALFRWSSLGGMYFEFVTEEWKGINLFRAYTALMVGGLLWLFISSALKTKHALPFVRRARAPLLIAICIGLIPFGFAKHTASTRHAKPHVIIIGVDSLRNDAVETSPATTPALDDFLHSAVRFTNATTPLARTFPSWVSIISGKHPHTTGAIINLLPRDLIHEGDTLPRLLSQAGYQSVYAIDEVRFSNLDLSYGFDRMIAPPIGATDFLIGFFGDAPLSNLLANTRIGEFLFPNLHANRAVAHVYNPDSFVDRLDREINFDQPTFLAAHLTLAHWPYNWSSGPVTPDGEPDETPRRVYAAAVARVDEQFGDLMTTLKRHGALENAIVIVISDHGESLDQEDFPAITHDAPTNVAYQPDHLLGHGTSVFAPSQYKVVFAMRSYGNALIPESGARIGSSVSLEDLTPTVLNLLGAPSPAAGFDGRSLTPLLSGDDNADDFAGRVRFTETEFNPKGFSGGAPISASALAKAAAYYRVDPVTDRVLVRQDLLRQVLEQRQYAALLGDSLAGAVPAGDGLYEFVYVPQLDPRGEKPNLSERARLQAALKERFKIPFKDDPSRN